MVNRKRNHSQDWVHIGSYCRGCGGWSATRYGLDPRSSNRICPIITPRAELSLRISPSESGGGLVLGIGLLASVRKPIIINGGRDDCIFIMPSVPTSRSAYTCASLFILVLSRKGRVWGGPLGVSFLLVPVVDNMNNMNGL